MTKNKNRNWVPEIFYEEAEEGITSQIPFISVPKDHEMPAVLFIFESKNTGEFEIDSSGNPLPIVDLDLFQYANMNLLKEKLSSEVYDEVRSALGLEDLKSASEKGANLKNNL
jgi:hypothetical protein